MKTSVLPQRSGSDLSGLPAIIVFILLQPFYLWNSSLPQIGPLTFAVMFIGVATILLDYALFERNRIRWFVILFASVVVGGLYAESIRNAVIDVVNSRFAGAGTSGGIGARSNELEYRHYDYLLAEPSRLLVGWGDGQFQKHFGAALELHATLPAILLCFGVPGITLFLLLIWNSVRANWKDAIVTLGPLLVYGFTHNGSRNPMLFAIFAVVAAQPFKKRVVERERAECSIAD